MNYFSWFFRWFVVYSTVAWHYSTAFRPLIFNPHTLEIFHLDGENSNLSNCRPCAMACPAESEAEKDFQDIDYRYRSVFIQQFVDESQQLDINIMTCKRDFVMAVLFHSKKGGKLVEFGFQGFLWLSKLEVRYDFSSRILISMRYKVRSIKLDQLKVACHDHELNGTWYNLNEHLNRLYLNNQNAVFREVKIPEGSCRSSGRLLQCVRKHSLVLPYQFQIPSQKTVSCSNMTTIPLWNDIPDALMYRMQLFLIAIAQVLGKDHELIVLPGVLGKLTLPSVINGKPMKIYLNDIQRKNPVPKTIYKIVRHRTYKCDEKKAELCWYDVVIVIHNYPEFTDDERLCTFDKCEKLGFESIQYMDLDDLAEGKSPFVYCCELTTVVAKSIGFPLGKTRNSLLNLTKFSIYDHILKRHREVRILDQVLEEFKKLIKEEGGGSQ